MNTAKEIFERGLLEYSLVLFLSYLCMAVISVVHIMAYLKKNSFVDYNIILKSPLAPSVSLIVPCFNEGKNIVENVNSLLALHYGKLELIIVNDGSTDDTMEKLINSFGLKPADIIMKHRLETKPIIGVYKSTNPSYKHLVIVDKMNGGKSDALNVGINVSSNRLISCIDADCIVEKDALLKMVKPFIEGAKSKVIAAGGVIHCANSCEIENGNIVKVHIPENFLARAQVSEYIRAFLLGRMAWSKLNGLLIISGAFGMFEKDIVIKAGGYSPKTVGEDMELVVRMRKYMHDIDQIYKVEYIPDPLCWTEVPTTYQILGRQRNRWSRGLIETLGMHKDLFFNRKYGILGMLSYPYWIFFEWLASIVEFSGWFYFAVIVTLTTDRWLFFLLLLGGVYCFSLMFSMFAILMEEISYNRYKGKKDIMKLILTAVIEPIYFHPFVVYWALQGNWDKLVGNNDWGVMTRKGFSKTKIKTKLNDATAKV